MKKVNYDSKPTAIESVGNGSYLYRWAIEATEQDGRTSWECLEVVVWNEPSASAITAAAIAAMWPSSEEKKLINDYNAAAAGLLDESYMVAYSEFLAERGALKEQIAADCAAYKGA
ncbi:MAG: hypothetical protein SNH88_04755 [Rikenellaceae bacterium]